MIVVGPTATGKSDLAVRLAERVGGEVVSADSQQVYRGMELGTGKLAVAERRGVPHHLLDVVSPAEEMTAARFLALADAALADAAARGRPVIVAGGTMLYVRVLLYGLFAGPAADPALRAALDQRAAAEGPEVLWHELAAVDPTAAARIDRRDARRIIRGLEVHARTGRPLSEHQRAHDFRTLAPRQPTRLVGLCPLDRAELYGRIDARVDQMMAAGLLAEVQGLRAAGFRPPLRSQQAIGYAELHRHLDGAPDLGEAVRLIKRNSRHYARRQLSWYRGAAEVEWHASADQVDLAGLERYLRRL